MVIFGKDTDVIRLLVLILFLPYALPLKADADGCFFTSGIETNFTLGSGNISQAAYREILNSTLNEFNSDFDALGGNLAIVDAWENVIPQAKTIQNGNTYEITVNGGLARHPMMTLDSLQIVFCHELGHHLGGAPKFLYFNGQTVEGQADYFATLQCTRRLFGKESNSRYLNLASKYIQSECKASFQDDEMVAICARTLMAVEDLALVLQSLQKSKNKPSLSSPDLSRTSSLVRSHAGAQCRVDTLFAGAVCPVSGTLSELDLDIGTCSRWYGADRGVRPLCWYDEKQNFLYPFDRSKMF